jgi:hypothetical protein
MKTFSAKSTTVSQTPIFPKAIHQLRTNHKAAAGSSTASKRDNTFSQSRDTREDRGSRQMKTSQNSQTFPHANNH